MPDEKELRQCHIHDEVRSHEIENIRENVCVKESDYSLTQYVDQKYYCLFHNPTKYKEIGEFQEIFQTRLKAVEKKAAEIQMLPEDERKEAKRKLSYDFRYVWFPSEVELRNYKFLVNASFSSATFSSYANFNAATFFAVADFESVTFSGMVSFEAVTFSDSAYFRLVNFLDSAIFALANFSTYASFDSVTFNEQANFMGTTFDSVYFNSATFSNAFFRTSKFTAQAEFKLATFVSTADFSWVKFLETSQVFFQKPRFYGDTDFSYSVFAGYVTFEGKKDENVFLDKESIKEKSKDLEQKLNGKKVFLGVSNIKNQKTTLNLQNARLENPERLSFHRVRLCPSWFVNSDSRKMVFTDVNWTNLAANRNNLNIMAEIKSLKKRSIDDPSRLLEIACRQLAVNAEENNRYEEAAEFRYMAMETKRLEKDSFWTLNWWYKFSSGYGEDWKKAAWVLVGVLLFFGLLYWSPFSRFDYGWTYHNMNLGEGLVHSLYVASFQRPEPKAADTLTKFFIILETIFAPLQAALLALAIRRKFMR